MSTRLIYKGGIIVKSNGFIMNNLKIILLAFFTIVILVSCSIKNNSDSGNTIDEHEISAPPLEIVGPTWELEAATILIDEEINLPDHIVKNKNGINIIVSPEMELLSIVQYLSDYDKQYGLITKLDFDYKNDVENYFGTFKDHPAVKFINDNMKKGFTFDSPPASMLYMKKDFTLNNEIYKDSANKENRVLIDIEEFYELLKAFYTDTDFGMFFSEHLAYYTEIANAAVNTIPAYDMIGSIENFYGKKMSGYNVIIVSLFHSGGFGLSIKQESGIDIYSITGPGELQKGIPVFGDVEGFIYLTYHEFGHSFIPVSGINESSKGIQLAIEQSSYLMKPIQDTMEKMAYPNWDYALEELILRAVVIKLMSNDFHANASLLLKQEYDTGFIYINQVYDSLEEYQQNREQYIDFDLFIPVLIEDLMEVNVN